MKSILDEFSYYLQARNLKPASISFYLSDIKVFLEYFSDTDFADITEEMLKIFYISQLTVKSSASVRRLSSVIRTFFKFLNQKDVCPGNPARNVQLDAYKKEEYTPKISEVQRLLSRPDTATVQGNLDKMMLTLLCCTKIHVKSMLSLTINDVDFLKGKIKVGKSQYKMNPSATQSLADYVMNLLLSGKATADSPLFSSKKGEAINRHYVWKMIKKYALEAGLSQITAVNIRGSLMPQAKDKN